MNKQLRFKIDENLPKEVAEELQINGYDAATVFEEKLVGASDSRIAEVCCNEERIIITLDLDFADIRKYPPHQFSGLIVIRLIHQDKNSVLNLLNQMISVLQKESIKGKLWIVENKGIRIRE